jgi:hypothetical protein
MYKYKYVDVGFVHVYVHAEADIHKLVNIQIRVCGGVDFMSM